ncbi:hypothetical protein A0H81_12453 [Grifola frondosa]|uniref:NADPH--cytochrome P450 reductase n=1 Tax=Grifola frondosa TaxID=5627 RepID=A0A1C7LSL8_GRIFR|nr:hypothetical protein A0H81_12453 [Grifola frondosa]
MVDTRPLSWKGFIYGAERMVFASTLSPLSNDDAHPLPAVLAVLGPCHTDREGDPAALFELLAEQYGEIYQLNMISECSCAICCDVCLTDSVSLRATARKIVVVCTYELMNEVSNDKRFTKAVTGALVEIRNGAGDGLFTAFNHEENWGIARVYLRQFQLGHNRLLMPAFSTAKIRDMFDDMIDISSQLITKWERFGPSHVIDPADDFARLTFDTIALLHGQADVDTLANCGLSVQEQNHSFIQAMADFLVESGLRANRPPLVNSMMRGTSAKYAQDIQTMSALVEELIAERKANPTEKSDLLNTMLYGKDTKTGKSLPEENIRYNLLTFLIAALLTFVVYHLSRNPEAMRKIREEVDEVLGDQQIQLRDVSKLRYTAACLRETLRINPTATIRAVEPVEDTTIGNGKYHITKDMKIAIPAARCMRDPTCGVMMFVLSSLFSRRLVLNFVLYQARRFKPERMLDEKFEALPPNAWQPFGTECEGGIGRPFAWQESIIAVASIIQKFDIVPHDPSYELELKQTLTIKPKDFFIHAIPRKRESVPLVMPTSELLQAHHGMKEHTTRPPVSDAEPKQPLYVLYGSNTGTSQTFAQRIASDAPSYGRCQTSMALRDAFLDIYRLQGYNGDAGFRYGASTYGRSCGEPADNAAHFVEWIRNLKGNEFANISYSVFGCGNRDWVRTYQRIPTLIDDIIVERGGRRLVERGAADASAAEFFQIFDEWEAKLWDTLIKSISGGLVMTAVDSGTARASDLRQSDTALGRVVENRILTASGAPVKRHIEFELPKDMTFRAGDYLAILPSNPVPDVCRVVSRFSLSPEQQITLSSVGPTSLPVGRAITVFSLLSGYVELSQPATTRDLRILSSVESSPTLWDYIQDLSSSYAEKVLAKRLSVLDILEDHPDIKLPFEAFLQMLPSMRIRQYSISSSPLWNPQRVSLTVSVVDAPALSGRKDPFLGVASTFLGGLRSGDMVQLAVRGSSAAFHPPENPAVPMVLFAAGSGLAPMRGFLLERAMQKKAGREVAKSVLFFGCRSPKEDYLYSDSDLKEWIELGVVDVKPAFSRSPDNSCGCKYVQDRVWHDRADINKAYAEHAKFYTCGAGRIAQGIKEVLVKIIKEKQNVDDAEAAALFDRATEGRYATDIFE